MAGKAGVLVAILGLLVFGALNTLTTKLQFDMWSYGADENGNRVAKQFQKPWFGTFTMFLGMTVVLFVHYAFVYFQSRGSSILADEENRKDPLLAETRPQISEFTSFLYVGVPGIFDLFGSGLMFIGLLYISASVWQMLRGSMIIFGAIISVLALGRKLYCFHWMAILICVCGIMAVGASNVLNAGSGGDAGPSGVTPKQTMMGMLMVVAGQVVTASQMVAEEKLLKDVCLPAMKIVGYEGVWGSIACLVLIFPLCYVIPGSDNGHFEDEFDSIVMIQNNINLFYLVLLYVFSCATYNCAGMAVTSQLSAVHRTMLEASRTAAIWGVDLFVHYCIDPSISFGEAWMPYSWLQLVGFGLLILGQLVYNAQLKIPGLYYPPPPAKAQWMSPAAMKSPVALPPAE